MSAEACGVHVNVRDRSAKPGFCNFAAVPVCLAQRNKAKRVMTVALTGDAETSQSIWQKKLAALPLESFGAGETVFAEGSKTGQLFILKSGAVSVVKSGTEIATVAEAGAIFGELSALLDQPHTADVRTLEPSQFHVADAATLLTKDPTALLYVAMILARRVDAANRALLELRGEIYAGEPVGLIDSAIGRIQGLLSAIGDGYVRAGANLSMFPPG
jgi:CRP/FNR family transcriptional regulator, cyclic AMP receptor protein